MYQAYWVASLGRIFSNALSIRVAGNGLGFRRTGISIPQSGKLEEVDERLEFEWLFFSRNSGKHMLPAVLI
jgi:hypothetical protein